ncbi:hypothetical protein [Nocardia colli]
MTRPSAEWPTRFQRLTAKAALIGGVTGCRYREEDLHKQPGN